MRSQPLTLFAFVIVLLFAVAPSRADWDPGDSYKMHYPQLPDLTPTGMDVLDSVANPSTLVAGAPNLYKILADDWKCTETGPVSDIHIWGSWLNNRLPLGDAKNVAFKLSIHADIPAPPTGGFSQPGAQLWSEVFPAGSFATRLYAPVTLESFYDPNVGRIIGTDNQVWQYNFTNIPNPFTQQVGTIYWLDVQALQMDPTAFFGWKTTNPLITPHFQDDAVFSDTIGFNGPLLQGWQPMTYPAGHPFAGISFDQAFVITTVPEPTSAALLLCGGVLLLKRRKGN